MAEFAAWSCVLRERGLGWPVFLIDRAALDANVELLRTIAAGTRLRLVLKSLPSTELIDYLMDALGTNKLMAFHLPFVLQAARRWPQSDIMLGKPLPVAAAEYFYAHAGDLDAFDSQNRLHWLIDTPRRAAQYAKLARRRGLRMSVIAELDVGMHRGGADSAEYLKVLLDSIENEGEVFRLAGFMGYDAHAGRGAPWVRRASAVARANQRYRELLDAARQTHPDLLPDAEQLLINGSGSPSCVFHGDDSPLNELAIGSVLLKPAEFDLPQLSGFRPAGWLASPVIKRLAGVRLPFLEWLSRLSRRHTLFVYGGRWPAVPAWPEGLRASRLYGPSFNQQFFSVPREATVQVDDFVFFRPLQSEQVMLIPGEVVLVDGEQVASCWSVLDRKNLAEVSVQSRHQEMP